MKHALGGLAFTLSMLVAGGEAWAADSVQLLQQKMALVEKLIGSLPRDNAADSPDLRKHAEEARAHLTNAMASLAAGDQQVAEAELDQAMRHLSKARKGGAGVKNEERDAYNQISHSMESMLESYRQSVERIDQKDPRRAQANTNINQVALMMDQARKLAESQVRAATSMMLAAQKSMLQGYSTVIGSDTVVYSQTFNSPKEEYRYELERNKSYQELIPLAKAELKPSPEVMLKMETMVEENRGKLKLAEVKAGQFDFTGAVASLREGTEALQRALLNAGLTVPGMQAEGTKR